MLTSETNCFLIGDRKLLVKCGEVLLEKNARICGVVTSDPVVIEWAGQLNLAVFSNLNSAVAELKAEPFDYLFSIGNLQLIPEEILKLPRELAVNFHDGPLPRYAGLHATSWALMNGETKHGVTWHVMTARPDEGDVLKQVLIDVAENETALSLNTKCLQAGIDSFRELVEEILAGGVCRTRQDSSKRSCYSKFSRPPSACCISWNWPAEKISAFVRALDFGELAFAGYTNPLGTAKMVVRGEYFVVAELSIRTERSGAPPGTVINISEEGFRVATSTVDVVVRKVLDLAGKVLSPQY